MDLTWAHVFPVVTLVFGAWLTDRAEWRRWRCDYFLPQIAARQVFFGDVLEAMHDQHRVRRDVSPYGCASRQRR